MYWDDAERIVRSARWPTERGKQIANNTRLFLETVNGEKSGEAKLIKLRFHATDIIVFMPNGDRYIHTGWTTDTTLERLREYGRINVQYKYLDAINGYRVSPERIHVISAYHFSGVVPFKGCGGPPGFMDRYIRISSDGAFDLTTVSPVQVSCVVDPVALRRRMLHIGKIIKLALGYAKLSGNEAVFERGTGTPSQWLLARINTPLEDIQLSPWPFIHHAASPKNVFKKAADSIRWDIARREGWLGEATLLKQL